ncbi:hypothetical protein [Fodinicola feengrottensis]|uniref:hypothetical protein n=1 Tax=Fodinicola feengrottensis TaxID=435914 RepID=UPI0013CF9356|nr:hypothetical protein [Fodinicola feengrottensis]
MSRKFATGILTIALAIGLIVAGPGAASAHPQASFSKWWSAVSSVYISGIKYDLTITLWQNNDNGQFHGEASGYPAGFVGLYDTAGQLLPGGVGKNVGYGDINTSDVGGNIQALRAGHATR